MAVTIKDIAVHTNLSIATVSKYINGIKVSDDNARIIEESIKKHDYHVNAIARGLKTSKTKTIGIVIPDLTDIYSSTVIKHFEKYISTDGYSILVCDCQSSGKIMFEKIEMLISKMVDGLLIFPLLDNKQVLEKLKRLTLPIITVDQKIMNITADFVSSDSFNASYKVGRHLLEQNHLNPAIITGPAYNFTSAQRVEGFIKAYSEQKITVDESNIIYTDYTAQGGYDALLKLWKKSSRPTAIFTTNYHTTLGTVMAASEHSLQIPRDFSLFAYDNFEISRIIRPRMSMVVQPVEEIGTALGSLFIKRLNGNMSNYPEEIILHSRLEFGESVMPNKEF